ncbi:MAG TPA: radical SAM protein [bacterium]|nr:radical SAM protein [bacterium]
MAAQKSPIYLVAQRKADTFLNGWVPPFGIMCVGEALRRAGHRVRLFHLSGDDDQALAEALASERPLFVGFSNSISPTVSRDLRLSRLVGAQGIKVVWGGMFATLLPEETLKSGLVDYVVRGEGERAATGLAEAIASGAEPAGIEGVGFRRGEEIVLTPPAPPEDDLDRFPHGMDLIDWGKYVVADRVTGNRITSLNLSRGCPFRCNFCYNSALSTRQRWRSYSTEYAAEMASYLKKRHGADTVCLQDDNPFGKAGEARRIIEALGLKWLAACQLMTVSKDFVAWCRETGCQVLSFGAESGSDRMLKHINKGFTSADLRERLGLFPGQDIEVWSNWMAFLPGETVEDRRLTFSLMDEIHAGNRRHRMRIAAFEAYPGTPFWDECVNMGFRVPRGLTEWTCYEKRIHRLLGSSDRQVKRMSSDSMLLYHRPQTEPSPVPSLLRPLLRRRFRAATFRGPVEEMLHYGRVARDAVAGRKRLP